MHVKGMPIMRQIVLKHGAFCMQKNTSWVVLQLLEQYMPASVPQW
jgi:hypothetical protein